MSHPIQVGERSVAEKMRIQPGSRVAFVNAPAEVVGAMALPPDVVRVAGPGPLDHIHHFATSQAELALVFPALRDRLARNGAMWVSWPKGGGNSTDLTLDEVVRIGYGYGLVESTCLSVDATWSAIRFTWPKPGKAYQNGHSDLVRVEG